MNTETEKLLQYLDNNIYHAQMILQPGETSSSRIGDALVMLRAAERCLIELRKQIKTETEQTEPAMMMATYLMSGVDDHG